MNSGLPGLRPGLVAPAGPGGLPPAARRASTAAGLDISSGRFLWYVIGPEGRVHLGMFRKGRSGGLDRSAMRRLRGALGRGLGRMAASSPVDRSGQ